MVPAGGRARPRGTGARLEALVGLACLKVLRGAAADCLARAALGDAPLLRRPRVGRLGSRKKLAAGPPRPPARPPARVARPPPAPCPPDAAPAFFMSILTQLLRALGVAKGVVVTEATLENLCLDVRRDVSCVVVDSLPPSASSRRARRRRWTR